MRVPSFETAQFCSTVMLEASKRGGRLRRRAASPPAASASHWLVGDR